ncbi:hypothetical protein CIHG_03899 [Coccidioides immitis H538.4]|uniref:Uncharacterized protein n=3 Tax=Coccidioides immitis TaxID=5501 RepID=A0A0J8QQQ0_COCIT|nr:hypothetical protein CIRG_03650 [Coccidioides immitis RMSCC 2394]KMU74929.1 hypothetical protein CISG_00858 [Coccidioides immitis RMSCC 3703]KMU86111.1 hypothetical protein CIHG_03899 [Coccidioides immitis H538.4]
MSSHIKPKQNQQAKSKQFCILSRLLATAIPLSASPIIPTRPGTSHTKLGSWTSVCHGVGLEARIFLVSTDASVTDSLRGASPARAAMFLILPAFTLQRMVKSQW